MIFLVMLLALFSLPARGFIFNVTYNCTVGDCIEGTPVIWNVDVSNEGGRFREITSVDLADAFTQKTFSSFDSHYNPYSDNRGDVIVLHAGGKITIPLRGKVPSPNAFGNSFIFSPCFGTSVRDSYQVARYGEEEYVYCFTQNFTISA